MIIYVFTIFWPVKIFKYKVAFLYAFHLTQSEELGNYYGYDLILTA